MKDEQTQEYRPRQKILKHSVKDVEEYYIDDEDGDEFYSE